MPNILFQSGGDKNMGWDTELFIPQSNTVRTEKKIEKTGQENKFVHCAECNELISVVSVTLYEIEQKHYCSECYSQKITDMAVKRDHLDLKPEKEIQK
jgi:putative lipase involved disintegration of autophagic bodies